jgi:hypothetical protein
VQVFLAPVFAGRFPFLARVLTLAVGVSAIFPAIPVGFSAIFFPVLPPISVPVDFFAVFSSIAFGFPTILAPIPVGFAPIFAAIARPLPAVLEAIAVKAVARALKSPVTEILALKLMDSRGQFLPVDAVLGPTAHDLADPPV